jgi:hypothetical protein
VINFPNKKGILRWSFSSNDDSFNCPCPVENSHFVVSVLFKDEAFGRGVIHDMLDI